MDVDFVGCRRFGGLSDCNDISDTMTVLLSNYTVECFFVIPF